MDDELLIELVREQPVLYNLKHKRYLDADWKARTWQEIGDKLNVEGSQCKSRWTNIRDNFRKSLAKRKTLSGQAAKKIKPYRFENQLQFLMEFMEERETKSNISSRPDREQLIGNDEQEDLTTDNSSSPETFDQSLSLDQQIPATRTNTPSTSAASNNTPSTSAPAFVKPSRLFGGRRKMQSETAASALMKYMLKKTGESEPTVNLNNPTDSFMFGMSTTLKSFPPYLQHMAKAEIFATVQKYEMQTLQHHMNDFPREEAATYPQQDNSCDD